MDLLLATTNRGKCIELSEALESLAVMTKTPVDFDITKSPLEHGDTYQANAIEKARFYFDRVKIPTLADDSGIIVEALKTELGVHTRRWGAGPAASDAEWIAYFLERMRQETDKRARFVCVLAYIDEDGKEHLFEGTCDGMITESLEAGYLPGLPISACFKPNGYDKVYAAMRTEDKNRISHRGRAVQNFRKFLEERAA